MDLLNVHDITQWLLSHFGLKKGDELLGVDIWNNIVERNLYDNTVFMFGHNRRRFMIENSLMNKDPFMNQVFGSTITLGTDHLVTEPHDGSGWEEDLTKYKANFTCMWKIAEVHIELNSSWANLKILAYPRTKKGRWHKTCKTIIHYRLPQANILNILKEK